MDDNFKDRHRTTKMNLDELNARSTEAVDQWKRNMERKYPGNQDTLTKLSNLMVVWADKISLNKEQVQDLIKVKELDVKDNWCYAGADGKNATRASLMEKQLHANILLSIPTKTSENVIYCEPDTTIGRVTITGNETLGELCQILLDENLFILQELACGQSFPRFFATLAKQQLPKMAMQIAKDTVVMFWGVFSLKSADVMAPILSTYLTNSIFGNGRVSYKVFDGIRDLINECLIMMPKVGFQGQQAYIALQPAMTKSVQLSFSIAEDMAAKNRPLSETLPILKDLGLTDNISIVRIVRICSYLVYRIIRADLSENEKDEIFFSIVKELTKLNLK